jgi:hypothetical protein
VVGIPPFPYPVGVLPLWDDNIAAGGSTLPFENLRVLSNFEGLTVLSKVEGEVAPTGRGRFGRMLGFIDLGQVPRVLFRLSSD